MSFRGPSIVKVNGGLGQQAPSDRNVAGLIFRSGYETGTFLFGIHKLTSLDEAEALGLSASTDANATTSTALCWYHISEFFRLNPDGTLYVYNGDDVAIGTVFAEGGLANDLMNAAANGIRYMGVVDGFDPAATLTIADGFADFVKTTADLAQAWVSWMAEQFVFVDVVVVEGVAVNTTTITDTKTWELPQVHVTAACDAGYFALYNAAFLKTAAVGTALGSIGVRMLSESMGSVTINKLPSEKRGQADYTLVDTRMNRWVSNVSVSNGTSYNALSQAKKDELTTKAIGYVGQYEGYPGMYFNADATSALATDDFNTVHANRVWNETARRIRRALIPRMNSRVLIDPATGRIKASTIADWDAAAKRELQALLAEGELADFRFVLDPNQDVLAQGKVNVRVRIVPQGIAKAIEAEIGFTNPAQA